MVTQNEWDKVRIYRLFKDNALFTIVVDSLEMLMSDIRKYKPYRIERVY